MMTPLVSLLQLPDAAAETSNAAGIERLRSWLRDRCAIDYPAHKVALLQSRLQRVADRCQVGDLDKLADLALSDTNGSIAALVVQAASTNHSYFYREPQVLEHIVQEVLPALSGRSDIRIWSAAASTGDEAYTVAMMAADALGLEAARRRVSILGTDISAPVIAAAESGLFVEGKLEKVPPSALQTYFRPAGSGQFAVADAIMGMCTFRRLNLKVRPWPFRRPFDVVLCRNVLYYFNRADQQATLEAIYDVTEPGGWLLTSVTETVRDLRTRWAQVAPGIYRRQS
jgi:chemotaxis protein methyltransferase CheR